MNKVDKLEVKLKLYIDKIRKQIKKLQSKCKHKNTHRWYSYEEAHETCKDCNYQLR